jgi:bla regulator protein BlaR1
MEYLLKTSALVVIFYLSYKLFLERDTFFESNRWFLLIGLVSSFIIPFLVIPIYVEQTSIDLSQYVFANQLSQQITEKPFNVLDYLPFVYLIGFVFFSVRFIFQFISLALVILNNKGERIGSYIYIKTTNDVSPFSFFNWIVFNPNQFSELELEQIITHEKAHANQSHSLDILLTHLSCIVLWFNPFIWFYNKDLKQNLEFIADKVTANNTECKKSYQYTLLKTSVPTHQMALSNNFYNSLIKKRIVMLHKSKSKKINQIKYAFVIPILALFLMSFNTKEIYVNKVKNPLIENLSKNEVIEVIITKDFTNEALENLKKDISNQGYNMTIKGVKRNKKGEITAIKIEVKSKSANANFNLDSDEAIKPIKITIENEGKNISIGNGDIKKSHHTTFITEDGETHDIDHSGAEKNVFIIKSDGSDADIIKEEIIIKNGDTVRLVKNINGNNIKMDTNEDVFFINKDNKDKKIHKVIKIKTSGKEDEMTWTSDYDEKVILNDKKETKVRIILSDDKAPLMILNGQEITNEEMNSINPNTIDKVEVLKDENATIKYGDKGKNGVVVITTKNKNESKYIVKLGGEALYLVDGKEVKKEVVDKLNPDNVASVNVLKGDVAIKKYGEKAKDGVVEIITKK